LLSAASARWLYGRSPVRRPIQEERHMVITNQTNQDYWFGPLHLAAGAGTATLTVDDTTATSLYLADDSVADAINFLYAQVPAKITVSGQALPFPRPTGKPDVVHGDGSPEGLVY